MSPLHQVREENMHVKHLDQRLNQQMVRLLNQKQTDFAQQVQALNLLSPLNIMGRGYSYTVNEAGKLIASVKTLAVGEQVTVHYQDGTARMKVMDVGGENE